MAISESFKFGIKMNGKVRRSDTSKAQISIGRDFSSSLRYFWYWQILERTVFGYFPSSIRVITA